ncbi:MAG TPA: HEAT repeat domain-containing protein [Methanocorpusculum sp.]|nr:HEAT repeat domain-containing protein [Methanocorpusculum sp.]
MNERTFARLVSDLESSDFSIVQNAANTITSLRDENAYPLILDALKKESPAVQRVMLWALQNYKDTDYAEHLIYLTSSDTDVREAAQVLFMEGGKSAENALKSAVHSADAELQYAAVETLGHLRTEAAEKLLIESLSAENSSVRLLAASALSVYPSDAATAALLNSLGRDDIVLSALFSLRGRVLSSEELSAVYPFASHADSAVRTAAVYVLDAAAPDSAADDSDAKVRRAAAETTASAAVLKKLMTDKEAFVRSAAVDSAAKQKLDVTDTFIRLLSDEHPGVRRAAAAALGNSGSAAPQTVIAALKDALHDKKPGVRAAAANALAEIATPDAKKVLEAALDEKNPFLSGIMKNALENLNKKLELQK